MVPLLINAPNIAIQRQSVETWWEKLDPPLTNRMETKYEDIPSLCGWFLKEKRDTFKRQTIIPGSSSNRRWFTIERISNSDNGSGDLALCYYKRRATNEQRCATNEQRCGWLFLNDVLSLSQDIPNRWITIEHPTRILRIQSPTPAQHRVWFSTLSKCCTNVRTDVVSPASSAPMSGDRRPSLPYFSEAESVRKAKKNSLKDAKDPIAGTPKDELHFLREITSGSEERKEVRKNLFSDPSIQQDGCEGRENKENVPCPSGGFSSTMRHGSFSTDESQTSASDLGARLGRAIVEEEKTEVQCEEKTEVEPLYYNGRGFEENPTEAGNNNAHASQSARTNDQFDMNELRQAFSKRDDQPLNHTDLPTSHSFSSSRQISRSSSYQLHFGNEDDDEIEPDDDFLNDDWDT